MSPESGMVLVPREVMAFYHFADKCLVAFTPQQEEIMISLRKARAALATAPASPAVDGWQPIETAPMDGTLVDLWRDGRWPCRIADAKWVDDEWVTEDYDRNLSNVEGGDIKCTHWKPRPEPPTVPFQRQWTGPGELERSGYIDKEPK